MIYQGKDRGAKLSMIILATCISYAYHRLLFVISYCFHRLLVIIDRRPRRGYEPSRESQGPPEYGRSCDYCDQVTIIAYYGL